MRSIVLLLLSALAMAPAVWAQTPWDPVPRNAYPGDSVFVGLIGGGVCDAARLDPDRPPRVSLRVHEAASEGDLYIYDVEYWVKEATTPVCAVSPGPIISFADVGPLPKGTHRFEITGYLEQNRFRSYTSDTVQVGQHPQFPRDVTGLWYDPAQSGRGLSVTRTDSQTLALLWFTHDAAGDPSWVVSNARIQAGPLARGIGLNTHGTGLAPGQATLTAQAWGELEFAYLGCGRAELRWMPLDPALPSGRQPLRKLAQEFETERCVLTGATPAVWGTRP
jgi:hypothetical protein